MLRSTQQSKSSPESGSGSSSGIGFASTSKMDSIGPGPNVSVHGNWGAVNQCPPIFTISDSWRSSGSSSCSSTSISSSGFPQASSSRYGAPVLTPLSSNGHNTNSGNLMPGRGIYATTPYDPEQKRRTHPEHYIKSLIAKLVQTRAKLYNQEHQLSKEAMLVVTNELQRLYRQLLIVDLDGAVQTQLEHLMWNDCFKKPLAFLKPLDPSLFHFVLENGVGFYLSFIQEVGCHFDVSFIRNSAIPSDELNIAKMKPVIKCSPSKAVVYYIIQSSLIHVGDLLRYRGSLNEALKMYDKSTAVSPTYGHPFNQMGQVQVMINDKELDSLLTAIYCYTRAICVGNPYLAAQKNLEDLLAKVVTYSAMPEKPEEDSILKFFRLIEEIISTQRNANSPEHQRHTSSASFDIRVELFTFSQLFRILTIALWAYKRESDRKLIGVESNHEPMALELIVNLLNGITATGCIDLKTVADFVGLSHLNILLEWFRQNPQLLQHTVFRANINVARLCRAANQVLKDENLCRAIGSDLYYVILPEEKRLLGFLPMRNSYEHLQSVMADADPRIIALRINRLSKLMEFLSRPEMLLLARFGQLYQPVIFCNMDPRELFPQPPEPRPNSTLQNIFDQYGAPIRDPQITIACEVSQDCAGADKNRQRRGLLSETLARVMEKERQQEFKVSGLKTPSPMEQLSIESNLVFGVNIASEMSPTPLTEADSDSRPTDTDFSKVFQSIWTPFNQNPPQNNNNNLWKF